MCEINLEICLIIIFIIYGQCLSLPKQVAKLLLWYV